MENVPVRINELSRKIRADGHRPKSPRSKLKTIIVSIVIVVLLAAAVVGGLFLVKSNFGSGVDSGKYQAVFLTSGQVYFGKFQSAGAGYARLTEVFYIQANSSDESQNPQDADTDTTDLQLIKLGNEVHGPEDEMLISRDQILFIENLKTDGKVSTSIKQYYDQLDD